MHTAEISPDITVFPLTVIFTSTDPAIAPKEDYDTPGTFTKPDASQAWLSATVLGTIIDVGHWANINLGPEVARVDVEQMPGDPKHIKVRVARN